MRRIMIAALAIVLIGTALIGGGIGLALAQGEDDPVQTFLGRVAEKLGIGEDELRSAMTEAQQDIIDEQVAEGLLTPEQGERLKERIEEEGLLGPIDRFRIGERVRHHGERLVVEAAATVLGMDPGDLLDELKDGKTMAEVAEQQGVEDFEAALLAQVRVQLDDLVAEGKLTEEQAEASYERIEENVDRIVSAQPPRFGPPRPCPGRFRGPWQGPLGDKPTTTAPSEVTA